LGARQPPHLYHEKEDEALMVKNMKTEHIKRDRTKKGKTKYLGNEEERDSLEGKGEILTYYRQKRKRRNLSTKGTPYVKNLKKRA